MTQTRKQDVSMRKQAFARRTATRIWSEEASIHNPYLATRALCHGYDLHELMAKRSFVDVFYLLFRGELPGSAQAQLLQTLMIALINPGPRHPATRAAMNAGIGKTNPLHIMPIAASLLGGEHRGGAEVEAAMRFLAKYQGSDPCVVSRSAMLQEMDAAAKETSVTPGFGKHYGGVDPMAATMARQILALEGAGRSLKWAEKLVASLLPHGIGWLMTGLAAAVFTDLGFPPRVGACLFQLMGCPGLLAHGLEMANQPINAMPFVSDENYVIER
ncbi:MAG TPA: citrate synthase [Cellvibrio sp.]|nr:citrate synthase [Cellvibrio sp.]